MSMTPAARLPRTLAALTIAAGLAHLPVTPEHLREAPYVGVSFVVFAVVAVVLGAYCWLRPSDHRGVAVAGVLSAAAIVTYAATRLVAFPEIGDDVGNWAEPWGVVSVLLETAAVVVAVLSRRVVAGASLRAHVVRVGESAVPRRAAA
ncbi:MAG TPA: hypothetical protein VFJ17_14855 [Mycobacteriales bacterium]|jgi:hypothetical protein|nr:hypothetical protein [Mycobacteriales bacterium]